VGRPRKENKLVTVSFKVDKNKWMQLKTKYGKKTSQILRLSIDELLED
jgi:hypothetical protein